MPNLKTNTSIMKKMLGAPKAGSDRPFIKNEIKPNEPSEGFFSLPSEPKPPQMQFNEADPISVKKNIEATTTISMTDKPIEEKKDIVIDFMNEDHLKNFVGKKSQEANANSATDNPAPTMGGKSISDAQKDIAGMENKEPDWTFDDYKMMASFMIELFDSGLTLAFRWFAKDTTDAPYQILQSKKNKLTEQLAYL